MKKSKNKILSQICIMFLKQRVDQYNLTRSWQICQAIYGRNICLQGEAIACISLLVSSACWSYLLFYAAFYWNDLLTIENFDHLS